MLVKTLWFSGCMVDMAIFIPGVYCGGTERMMVHLAGGFSEHAMRVDVVLTQAVGDCLASVPGKESIRVGNTTRVVNGECVGNISPDGLRVKPVRAAAEAPAPVGCGDSWVGMRCPGASAAVPVPWPRGRFVVGWHRLPAHPLIERIGG